MRSHRLIGIGILCALFGALALTGQASPWPWPQAGSDAWVQAQLNQAYALLRAEKLQEAAGQFERVLERDPANRTARLELAYLYARLERWQDAVRCFGSVSKEEPENARLRMDYGYALERIGASEQAEAEFQAVAEQSGEFQAHAQAAVAALRARRAEAKALARDAAMNRGYAELRAGNAAAGRRAFEQALAEDPANVTILKQLGYLALQENNVALAAQKFEAARAVAPQDQALALELGYLYERMDRAVQAEEAFVAAAESQDARTRGQAEGALRNLRLTRLSRVYLDVFASPLYSTRFSNAIAQFQAQLHWRPLVDVPVSFYLGTRITHDSRSRGGQLPAIFSDNAALFGAGVSFRPRRMHFSLFAEANVAINLTQSAVRNRAAEPDYRAGLLYYRRWDGRFYGPLGLLAAVQARGERLFTDVDASLAYYSRYAHNGIAYLQVREGLHVGDWGPSRFWGYSKLNLVKDTNRDFYNNLGEIGAGVEWRPTRELNLSLRPEYLHGIYYGIEGRDANPFRSQYNDFRLTLLFGERFRLW